MPSTTVEDARDADEDANGTTTVRTRQATTRNRQC